MIKLSEMFNQMQVYSNPQATPFKPKVEEDFDAVPAKWSSAEAKYDAMDIIRGIETGALNRTHEGERPFMKMLWRKVRKEFRRYLPKGKLRR